MSGLYCEKDDTFLITSRAAPFCEIFPLLEGPRDRLDFEIDNGAIRVTPVAKGGQWKFMEFLSKSSRIVSVEEMNDAIAEGAGHGGS